MSASPATAIAPLHGLVLAGGASRRMKTDKAGLEFAGETQLARVFALLAAHCGNTFVSVRPEQAGDPLRSRFAQIQDVYQDMGPLGGILSAQQTCPDAAWLVLACDLPLLDEGTLRHLIERRDPRALASVYRSSRDGLPEPLCAIYEPASREVLLEAVQRGIKCPRKILIEADIALLEQPSADALENINTPEDLARARAALGAGGVSR